MFESERQMDGVGDTAVDCASALADSVVEQRRVGARRMALAAQWADLHSPDAMPPASASPWQKRTQGVRVEIGAEGTPVVSEFAITELGMLLQTTTPSAHRLLRDVLELRHRMPLLWQAVMTGQVEDWKARKIIATTRVLPLDKCLQVDEQVLEAAIGLPFGRALDVVESKVLAADPKGHETRREEDARRRYVSLGRRDNTYGLRTLIARGQAADMLALLAMVDHLATLLGAAGNTDPADVRRATALAMLADPARACVFLAEAAAQQASTAVEPVACPEEGAERPSRRETPTHPSTDTPTDTPTDGTPDGTVEDQPAQDEWFELAPEAVEPAIRLGELFASLGPTVADRLRPVSVLHLHLAAEAVTGRFADTNGACVARSETLGALSIAQLQEILGTHRVTVRPVLDPLGLEPVDAYEIPLHLREALISLHPVEVFPYGTTPSRKADLDHTIPYDTDGPPGQTRRGNLGPLGRHHHRAKTFGGFTVHQPVPGLYFWRTPTGHWYQVDHQGTTALGTEMPEALRPRPPQVDTVMMQHLRVILAA